MSHKQGNQTFILDKPVFIRDRACIVGNLEKQGPLGAFFDQNEDEYFGQDTWEKAESQFLSATYSKLLAGSDLNEDMIDCILGGDLLNQCSAASFGLVNSPRPFFGLFGACSTMAESMAIGSLLVDGGGVNNCVCITSSHFCSAEKQFRFPLELGTQRAPTSQWTVTGSGGVILSSGGTGPVIRSVTPGIMTDMNVTDTNNMGAAMACAAASTIVAHLRDTNRAPDYYDLIVTGDLGIHGRELLLDVLEMHGVNIHCESRLGSLPSPISPETDIIFQDCGAMIFDPVAQNTCSGGSGCGCSASVLTSYLLKLLEDTTINKILFVATGALMSPVSVKQGEPIIGIAHGLAIENM